jgi:hypothetical protein
VVKIWSEKAESFSRYRANKGYSQMFVTFTVDPENAAPMSEPVAPWYLRRHIYGRTYAFL